MSPAPLLAVARRPRGRDSTLPASEPDAGAKRSCAAAPYRALGAGSPPAARGHHPQIIGGIQGVDVPTPTCLSSDMALERLSLNRAKNYPVLGDPSGLYIQITPHGAKPWLLRVTTGRRRIPRSPGVLTPVRRECGLGVSDRQPSGRPREDHRVSRQGRPRHRPNAERRAAISAALATQAKLKTQRIIKASPRRMWPPGPHVADEVPDAKKLHDVAGCFLRQGQKAVCRRELRQKGIAGTSIQQDQPQEAALPAPALPATRSFCAAGLGRHRTSRTSSAVLRRGGGG